MIKRAVFLDRDGTINEDTGDLFTVKELRFIPTCNRCIKTTAGEISVIYNHQSGWNWKRKFYRIRFFKIQ